LRYPDGTEQEVSVDGARWADDAMLMKLYSVDDRGRADELRGALICVRRGDFPSLEAGEFYVCDIEGARVLLRQGEGVALLGSVRELRSYPTLDVVVVTASDGGKDWEVPLLDAFIEKVDVDRREVIVASLEGLERG
jgi:16S rRNA processing protein RimM